MRNAGGRTGANYHEDYRIHVRSKSEERKAAIFTLISVRGEVVATHLREERHRKNECDALSVYEPQSGEQMTEGGTFSAGTPVS